MIMNNKILMASGQQNIDDAVNSFENYQVIGTVSCRKEIYQKCKELSPDILIAGEGLFGQESFLEILIKITKDFPKLRIIYLAGYADPRDLEKINSFGMLVMSGIYDIVHEKSISVSYLKNLLNNPKTLEKVSYLTKGIIKKVSNEAIKFEIPEEKQEDEDMYKNLYVISSIKPGTGKSFLACNIATAIANYGVEKPDGKKPRVALIEADLQNLSIGTLLGIEDDKKNLKTVMDKIATIVTPKGISGNLAEIEEVNDFIKTCFKSYNLCKNLECLVGSQLTLPEIENISSYYYLYLIESIHRDYDAIIVDTNSSMAHITTLPLLNIAKHCYYILNLDFNNVRNNVRYKDFLKEIGVYHKVKYILNQDIINDTNESPNSGVDVEPLIFTADNLNDSYFTLEARIPIIPQTVFLNRLYEGTPIVLDDKKYTLKTKYEILKVANQIWPIKNFKELEDKVLNTKQKKKSIFDFNRN